MIKKILKASIGLKDSYPFISLQDEDGTTLMGSCLFNSVESLAREYQLTNEYNNKEKYKYFVIFEGQTEEIQLFQKPILQNYGEPTKFLDETNKNNNMENMFLLINKPNDGVVSMSMTDVYFLNVVDKEGNQLGTVSVEAVLNQLKSYNKLNKYFNKE